MGIVTVTIQVTHCYQCPYYSSAYGDNDPWCREADRSAPWYSEKEDIPMWCPYRKENMKGESNG